MDGSNYRNQINLMQRFYVVGSLLALFMVAPTTPLEPGENPIFRDAFTADPAPLVVGDTLFAYVGHDEATGEQMFNVTEYSTTDMKHWKAHGPIMKPTHFSWAVGEAWASQVVEKTRKGVTALPAKLAVPMRSSNRMPRFSPLVIDSTDDAA